MMLRPLLPVLVALILVVALAGPAGGQEPDPSDPGATTAPTGLPPSQIGDEIGDTGSPQVFVVLSLLGGVAAATVVAVQWFRTRPGERES